VGIQEENGGALSKCPAIAAECAGPQRATLKKRRAVRLRGMRAQTLLNSKRPTMPGNGVMTRGWSARDWKRLCEKEGDGGGIVGTVWREEPERGELATQRSGTGHLNLVVFGWKRGK